MLIASLLIAALPQDADKGADSPRFVNGVLDAAAHRLDLIPS